MVPDEHGPYGAKGVGEIGLVPTAPAVANAFWAYDGERRRDLPMQSPTQIPKQTPKQTPKRIPEQTKGAR